MTLEEFVIETKTLEDFYGKEYNQTQIKIMFDELKYYQAEKYRKAILNVCKTSQYRPTLSQILEIIRTIKLEPNEKGSAECKACKGTGYVVYHKIVNDYDYEYAALCNCQNANGKDYDGTKIADKEHRSKYYIAKGEEVFGITQQEKPKTVDKDIQKIKNNLVEQMSF